MTTALELITGALQFLEVIAADESATASDADLALTELNEFLVALNSRGGFYAGGTLTLSSIVPLPDELIYHLKRAFAMAIQPAFAVALTQAKAAAAMKADEALISNLHKVSLARVDRALLGMPSSTRYYRYRT
jgi:hypothetical protein